MNHWRLDSRLGGHGIPRKRLKKGLRAEHSNTICNIVKYDWFYVCFNIIAKALEQLHLRFLYTEFQYHRMGYFFTIKDGKKISEKLSSVCLQTYKVFCDTWLIRKL